MSKPPDDRDNSPKGRCPFRLERCGDLTPLRDALKSAGYDQSSLGGTVKLDDSSESLDVPALVLRTAERSPYHTLVRLFVLALSVPEQAARDALAPIRLESLVELGLLQVVAEQVHATAALFPYEDLLLARDFWPQVAGGTALPDYVPGVGPSSLALANLTVRKDVASALDLGTGSGVQALWAAQHADHVIGTDTNCRALSFAALNARLNGRSNIEVRHGSLLEPVSECQFDLVVANPPYVISPKARLEYRDSGMEGDAVCERVIRGIPALLREGGYGTVIFNWHHQTTQDWAERPSQWLQSSGCDAWLMCSNTSDPIAYASDWLRRGQPHAPDRYPVLLDEWLAYYRELGIGMISWGAVILRPRAAQRNWLRAEKALSGRPTGSCSDQIQRVFAAEDLLDGLNDDRRLLELAFQLTPDHQLEHVLHAEDDAWTVHTARLSQTRGFGFVGQVDPLASKVLAGCNGRRRLGELVAELTEVSGLDFDQVTSACVTVIRNLLRSGFLVQL